MPEKTLRDLRAPPAAAGTAPEGLYPVGLCIADGHGTILRVTEGFCRLHGRTERDLIGHPASVLSDAGYAQTFSAGYVDLLGGKLGPGAELRFPMPGQPGLQMVARTDAMPGMAGGHFTITTVTVQDIHQLERPDSLIGKAPGFAILAMVGDGIVGCDRHGIIDTFDSGAERLFGYGAAEVIGSNVSVLIPESYREHHDRYVAEARLRAGRHTGERQRKLSGRRKDGSTFPLQLLVNERPGGFVAVLLHDGDHEMNRSSLEQTSARLYDALGNLKEGFLLCDARDRIVLANARMRSLFPEIADLIAPGRSFADLVRGCAERGLYQIPEATQDSWVAERLARRSHLPSQFEIDIRGDRRIEIRELATAEGACLTVYDDVTDRHLREEQLRRREAELSAAQRIAKLGGWRVDLRTGAISWSREMYRLFDEDPDAFHLSPEAVFARIHPEDRDRVRRLLTWRGRRTTMREWEFRIQRPSGEERVLWAESQCESDSHGEMVARFGVCQDITARKLDQLALIRTKEAAERANASKSQFLANMSHELRTPLNAVIGFSEMMASEVLGPLGNPRYRDYAESIQKSGNHLLELINEVLDLSKVEAGRFELSDESVTIADAFADALRLVGPRATEKGTVIAGSAKLAPDLRCDRRALRQMLVNLLSNAVKFTPTGGHIDMRAIWDINGMTLEVADTGVGIPPERIRDLAQPFVQVDTTLNRRHAGTGIGLYLTRSLVELHGGRLVISSRQGERSGTTVGLVFPVERLCFYSEP